MSTGSGIRAGRAFMEFFVNDSAVALGLRNISRTMRSWGSTVSGIGVPLAGVGAAILAPFALFAQEAASAQVTTQLLRQRFEEAADSAINFSQTYAAATIKSRYTIQEALSTFQAFFLGLGFGAGESAKFSQAMVELSADIAAAFPGIAGLDDAIRRFVSALSGSPEVLDRFGINLKEAAIQTELLNLGFKGSVEAASEQIKVFARMSASIKALQSQGNIGKAIELANTLRNQIQGLTENFKDLRIAIGNAFLGMGNFVASLNDILRATTLWLSQNEEATRTVAKFAVGLFAVGTTITAIGLSFKFLGFAVSVLTTPFRLLTNLFGIVLAAAKGLFSILGGPIALITSSIGIAVVALSDWSKAWSMVKDAFMSFFASVSVGFEILVSQLRAGNFENAWKAVTLSLEIAWTELWVNIRKVANEAWIQIQTGWAKLQQQMGIIFIDFLNVLQYGWETYRDFSGRVGEGLYLQARILYRRTYAALTGQDQRQVNRELSEELDAQLKVWEEQSRKRLEAFQQRAEAVYGPIKEILEDMTELKIEGLSGFIDVEDDFTNIQRLKTELESLRLPEIETDYASVIDEVLAKIKEIASGYIGATGKIQPFSIFGGFGSELRGQYFGRATAQERTAVAAEKIVDNTERTVQGIAGIGNQLEALNAYT